MISPDVQTKTPEGFFPVDTPDVLPPSRALLLLLIRPTGVAFPLAGMARPHFVLVFVMSLIRLLPSRHECSTSWGPRAQLQLWSWRAVLSGLTDSRGPWHRTPVLSDKPVRVTRVSPICLAQGKCSRGSDA